MPYFLRKIRRGRWDLARAQPYLDAGDLPADPLADFVTQDNCLSVWHVEDDRSNLESVVTALASTMDGLSNVDYALFDQRLANDLNIKVRPSESATPHTTANAWHRELCDLSAADVVRLTEAILPNVGQRDRVPGTQVRRYLREAIAAGAINPAQLKKRMRDKIAPEHGRA